MTKKSKRTIDVYQLKQEYKAIGYLKANLSLFIDSPELSSVTSSVPETSAMKDPFPLPIEEGINQSCYELVYRWQCGVIAHSSILSSAFSRFNEDKKPAGYIGTSLSVSDILIIDGQAYICAPRGWLKVELNDGANAPV